MIEINKIYIGDNLSIMKDIPDNFIDLIYLDPPFFSQRNYGEFNDKWKSRDTYLNFIKERLIELHRVLKSTGSIYLHCDPTASHYLKIVMDTIFDENNFRNEIIWWYKRWSNVSKNYQRMHDVILFYSKTNEYTYNLQYQNYSKPETIENTVRELVDGKLRRAKNEDGSFVKRTKENLGVPMHDVWELQHIQPTSHERLGFPTQKPEKLLERIIKASSNPGNIILDPFCGCGTTVAAAEKLGRQWIGIDISQNAINLAEKRIKEIPIKQKSLFED